MTEEQHPLDYLPELALGVLAEDDAPRIREHLESCGTCRAEYETMVGAARLLPFAMEEVQPRPEVRAGLMERIATEPRPLRPRPGRPRWQRLTAIAAAAAVLVVVGGFAGALLTGGNDDSLKAENSLQRTLVEGIAEGNARRDTAEQDGARTALVYVPGSSSAFAWVENLPALPDGKAYQAWFIQDGHAVPSDHFSHAEGGVWLSAPGDVSGFGAFALTIEDKNGAKQPTSDPFVVVTLGSAASRQPFTSEDWVALTGRN
ncbi:MAG: anti-sigma factor [Dehalococcoidia bacterium]